MNKKSVLIVKSLCITLLLAAGGANAAAGYIVKDATLTSVANTFGAGDNFIVNATGGTGTCQGQNITFKLDTVVSETIHARGYSAALTAFASGSKVNIWSNNGTCEGASHIQVKK